MSKWMNSTVRSDLSHIRNKIRGEYYDTAGDVVDQIQTCIERDNNDKASRADGLFINWKAAKAKAGIKPFELSKPGDWEIHLANIDTSDAKKMEYYDTNYQSMLDRFPELTCEVHYRVTVIEPTSNEGEKKKYKKEVQDNGGTRPLTQDRTTIVNFHTLAYNALKNLYWKETQNVKAGILSASLRCIHILALGIRGATYHATEGKTLSAHDNAA